MAEDAALLHALSFEVVDVAGPRHGDGVCVRGLKGQQQGKPGDGGASDLSLAAGSSTLGLDSLHFLKPFNWLILNSTSVEKLEYGCDF